MNKKRKILVTSALPYANGDIHLGHLVEYLQTDFWVRFQKMRGHDCHYMCADDTHGTPIMISARDRGITPEALIAECHDRHFNDFKNFKIEFDNYYTTNSPENRELSSEIFLAMKEKGHIEERTISQLYCAHDRMFLPDRFVTGVCPSCGAEGQYGDSCDVCSATYSPSDLKDAACVICGKKPELKESVHLFFKLNNFRDFLKGWVRDHASRETANKLEEWLSEDLRDWDISRDAPYFGFEIPGYKDKFFYVWVDAPIGYISATKNWCDKNGRDYKEFWKADDAELYHFIGKDIVYFHTLFWPAMLHNAGYKTPDSVFVHGFLTVNGEKMSKSKGTFIKARTYLDHLSPAYLRYYYACKLNATIDDVDLSFDDFVTRVNSELIGKITNIASRSIQMLKKLELKTGVLSDDGKELVQKAQERSESIARHYEDRNFSKAIKEVRELAEDANRYIDHHEPWKHVASDPEKVRSILTALINVFRIITVYLKPVLPAYAADVEELLNSGVLTWNSVNEVLENHVVKPYKHLLNRIEKESCDAIIESEVKAAASANNANKTSAPSIADTISFDDFAKVDLRVAEVINAEDVEGADKLLKLTIWLGGDDRRTIFAGIKKYYSPEQIKGRLIAVVANLAPRKMKFGLSEGMLLAASAEDKSTVLLLAPDSGAKPGQKIS
ncbi:MAG: methionine--tRNA ligase [Spirochaetes bacterium]|nr:methionine--tRNA ligase [Spirochaetota bacterium]MBN2770858.1 methionine--tRNA ligase [Spirochaetota bacterium]